MKRFTLIELLIVVGIIAILLSILLPSLSRVKRSAQMAVCSSNLSQVGKATYGYLKNSKQKFPNKVIGGYHWTSNWFGKKGSGFVLSSTRRPVNKYLAPGIRDGDELEAMKCPSETGVKRYHYYGTSYGANSGFHENSLGWKSGGLPVNHTVFVAEVNNPAKMSMVQEHPVYWITYYNSVNSDNAYHFSSTDKKYSMLFVDGHVATKLRVDAAIYTTSEYTLNNN